MTNRREFLGMTAGAGLGAGAIGHRDEIRTGSDQDDPDAGRHRFPRAADRRGGDPAGAQGHAVQSRQDPARPVPRPGEAPWRPREGRSEGPRGAQVGRGRRHLGQRPAMGEEGGGRAGPERRALHLHLVDLRLRRPEQARDRRNGPGGHDRRPDDREDRRPDLRRPEGADAKRRPRRRCPERWPWCGRA